jgi:ketosteroid isomerase-like protein
MSDNDLTPELLAFIRQAADRQAILDSIHRYTRGVDRGDRALMLSAYHPDARDEHGVANLDAPDFVDWAIGWHNDAQLQHQHIVTNHTVELDGDTAHAETYYIFWGENREGPPTLAFGRYIDRFEKREGRWAIAHRVCVNQLVGRFETVDLPPEWRAALLSTGPSRRDRGDVSYQRPLVSGLVPGRTGTG